MYIYILYIYIYICIHVSLSYISVVFWWKCWQWLSWTFASMDSLRRKVVLATNIVSCYGTCWLQLWHLQYSEINGYIYIYIYVWRLNDVEWWLIVIHNHLEVSKVMGVAQNRLFPNGKSDRIGWFGGTPISGNPHVLPCAAGRCMKLFGCFPRFGST